RRRPLRRPLQGCPRASDRRRAGRSGPAGRRKDGGEIRSMVLVVLDRLLVEEPLLVGVLQPAGLGPDGQVTAQLARDTREFLTHLIDRSSSPVCLRLGVDDVSATGLPVRIRSLMGGRSLADGK